MDKAILPYSAPGRSDVVGPGAVDPRAADVEAVARWLDYVFVLPGGFRFGLVGIIGMIPGFGDVLDAVLSLYILLRAVQLGVPRVTLTRMVVNVGIEAVAGSLPFVGALFDTVFKANRRNYVLVKRHLSGARGQTRKDWLFVLLAAAVAGAGVVLPFFVIYEIVKHL